VFVFYPFAFSPVCTGQLQLYESPPSLLGELAELGAKLLRDGLSAAFADA
jgi:peroxiredoxin